MKYQIGQYSSFSDTTAKITDYIKDVDINSYSFGQKNILSEDGNNINGTRILHFTDELLKTNVTYYLRVSILKTNNINNDIKVFLCNYNNSVYELESNKQNIDISDRTKVYKDWIQAEYVFSPNNDFDCICFSCGHELLNIVVEDFVVVEDLITSKMYSHILTHLGIQGTSGLSACLNQSHIILGTNGKFEFESDIVNINFLGLIFKSKYSNYDNLLDGLKIESNSQSSHFCCKLYDKIKVNGVVYRKTKTITDFIIDYIYKE